MKLAKAMTALTGLTLTVLFAPVSHACEKGYTYSFEHMVSIPKDLKGKNADVDAYPFKASECVKEALPGDNVAASLSKKREDRHI